MEKCMIPDSNTNNSIVKVRLLLSPYSLNLPIDSNREFCEFIFCFVCFTHQLSSTVQRLEISREQNLESSRFLLYFIKNHCVVQFLYFNLK